MEPMGLRVNAIAPGFIETPMSGWMHADAATHAEYRPPARAAAGPARRIADAVLYLASQASAYVTGHVLLVDGGVSKT